MALIKKNKDEAPAASAEAEAPPAEDPAEATPAPGEAAPPAAVQPAADPLAGGADALLNMFQTTQTETDDRSRVLDLTPDVELADLLEDLHTVVAALNRGTSR